MASPTEGRLVAWVGHAVSERSILAALRGHVGPNPTSRNKLRRLADQLIGCHAPTTDDPEDPVGKDAVRSPNTGAHAEAPPHGANLSVLGYKLLVLGMEVCA